MALEQEPCLFEIRVNENGKSYIRKFWKLIVFGLILFSLTFIIGLYMSARYIFLSYANTDLAKIPLTLRVTYYFSTLTSIVNLVAIIFYARFANLLRLGLTKNDEQMFNRAFRYLSQNALLFIVTMVMTLLTWSWSLVGGWFLDNF